MNAPDAPVIINTEECVLPAIRVKYEWTEDETGVYVRCIALGVDGGWMRTTDAAFSRLFAFLGTTHCLRERLESYRKDQR